MTTTAVKEPVKERRPLNGVNTPALFATINAVGANPSLAKFQFRATNRWCSQPPTVRTVSSRSFGTITSQS